MLQRGRGARTADDGFTLIELLIVIVILGVLAGIVVFGVGQFRDDSKTAACAADKKTVEVAADAYDASTGEYPSKTQQLLDKRFLAKDPLGVYVYDVNAKSIEQTACRTGP
ncbi:MAG: prepilin-type N-terminal cleavage/methylation domain-containing protein [Mycobacteriales bacterium]